MTYLDSYLRSSEMSLPYCKGTLSKDLEHLLNTQSYPVQILRFLGVMGLDFGLTADDCDQGLGPGFCLSRDHSVAPHPSPPGLSELIPTKTPTQDMGGEETVQHQSTSWGSNQLNAEIHFLDKIHKLAFLFRIRICSVISPCQL